MTLFFVAACSPSGTVPLAVGDLAYFEDRVEPDIEERCGSSGCHGRPDRPFSIFTPGQHRADPRRRWLDEPLTAAEVHENARRVAALGIGDDPEQALIVRKPLAVEDGGLWHGGGDVFITRGDEGCVDLVAWLSGRLRARDGGPP